MLFIPNAVVPNLICLYILWYLICVFLIMSNFVFLCLFCVFYVFCCVYCFTSTAKNDIIITNDVKDISLIHAKERVKNMTPIFKKLTSLLAIFCMLTLVIPTQNGLQAAANDIVNIPDNALKSAINTQLGQNTTADITELQMESLIFLSINDTTLDDLTGIEYATNLESLLISAGTITDISPVVHLHKLTSLKFNNVPLVNLPDLNGLTELLYLDFDRTQINNESLSSINQLPNLQSLYMSNVTTVTDISALASLPKLQTLMMQFSGVYDFTVINDFPSLTHLAAFGQNHGDYAPVTTIKNNQLELLNDNTLFIPFSLMPNRLTNFDGYQPPFTSSTASSDLVVYINNTRIDNSRLANVSTGITITGYDTTSFYDITHFSFNTRYNNLAGTYATPPNFTFYAISSGVYYQEFNVNSEVIITAEPSITYDQYDEVTEAEFLATISAKTNDNSPITSNFLSVVNFNIPGTYTVELNAEDEFGNIAAPVEITVIISPQIVMSHTITYDGNGSTNGAVPTDNNNPYPVNSTVYILGASSLEKTGYSFINWNTSADGTGTSYEANDSLLLLTDITLYAQWDEIFTEESTSPVEESTSPVEESTSPVEESTSPVEESTSPVEESTNPVEESTNPVEESTNPVEESTSPVEESTSPVEESTNPVEESTGPNEEFTSPIEESTSTIEETTNSMDETTSVTETPQHVTPSNKTPQSETLAKTGSNEDVLLLVGGTLFLGAIILLKRKK